MKTDYERSTFYIFYRLLFQNNGNNFSITSQRLVSYYSEKLATNPPCAFKGTRTEKEQKSSRAENCRLVLEEKVWQPPCRKSLSCQFGLSREQEGTRRIYHSQKPGRVMRGSRAQWVSSQKRCESVRHGNTCLLTHLLCAKAR